HAVVDAGLKLRTFFVVVPRHHLDAERLGRGGVVLAYLGHALQEGLPALLRDQTVGAPKRQRIVEALVGGTDGILGWKRKRGGVIVIDVAEPGSRGLNPGVPAIALRIVETDRVAEDEQRIPRDRRANAVPIDGVSLMPEEEEHRAAVVAQV